MSELGDKLAKPLDAARVKSRPNGRGGQLSYLEAHDVIRTANDIFGFGKWGHEVVELRQIDAITVHNNDQKAGWCVGYVCVIRLTVEGCVPMSGVGYGDATEYRESALVTAHELAAKEAEADAMKRALKNFGDQFGLALYDKAAATSGRVVAGTGGGPAASQGNGDGPKLISDAQRKRLRAIQKKQGVSDDQLKELVVKVAGVQSSAQIPVAKYDELVEAVELKGSSFYAPESAADIPFMPTIS